MTTALDVLDPLVAVVGLMAFMPVMLSGGMLRLPLHPGLPHEHIMSSLLRPSKEVADVHRMVGSTASMRMIAERRFTRQQTEDRLSSRRSGTFA